MREPEWALQAGGYQFHPTCAQCSRCGEAFGDGAEMYMQGDEIWHPACNDVKPPERIVHRHSAERASHRRRHESPKGPHARRRREEADSSGEEEEGHARMLYNPKYTVDFGKHLTYMYLLPEPTNSYLKQPIGPHPPEPPNFHTPKGPVKIRRARVSMLKTGMMRLTEQMEADLPRPKSPHMDNEEPIEASMYPGAHAPDPGQEVPIDREDFPAPPFPYAIEEIRKRLSETEPDDDDEEDADFPDATAAKLEKKKKAAEELRKLEPDSSLIHQLAVAVEEEEKKRRVPLHLDPRSASRTPSAKKLPHFKCRYESATNASPSRYQNRPRPWEQWKEGRGATATIGYSASPRMGPGLGPKSSTLPVGYANGASDYADAALEGAYSNQSLEEERAASGGGGGGRMGGTMPLKDVGQQFRPPSHAAPQLRTSLPDMSKPIRVRPL